MKSLVLIIFLYFLSLAKANTEIIYPAKLSRRSSSNITDGIVETSENGGCACNQLEITSTNEAVRRKHADLLGQYDKMDKIENGLNGLYNGRPGYQHSNGKFYLYYNSASQGFWAIGEHLGSEVVRLENQGDRMCPYYLKSLWRYADGDLNALVYDSTLKATCLSDPCSIATCGHQARCVLLDAQDPTVMFKL